MAMYPQPIGPVPEDTARVARAAFLKGTTYIQMRECSEQYTMMRSTSDYTFAQVPNPMAQAAREVQR